MLVPLLFVYCVCGTYAAVRDWLFSFGAQGDASTAGDLLELLLGVSTPLLCVCKT